MYQGTYLDFQKDRDILLSWWFKMESLENWFPTYGIFDKLAKQDPCLNIKWRRGKYWPTNNCFLDVDVEQDKILQKPRVSTL